MKIGDKVRFLNDVGGGVVAGFQDRETALVRDEDGFDVPVLTRECVVIETDNYNLVRKPQSAPVPTEAAGKAGEEEAEPDPADRPLTFRPRPQERKGGEALNVALAFVPVNVKELSDTSFEAYLVNDCNYYVRLALLTHEGAACTLRHEILAEPNTKVFLEEFRRDVLGEWEKLTVQLYAFKQDKTFLPQPAMSVSLRPDCTKFYKLHTFMETDFFEEPAYICDIVREGKPVRSVFVSAGELKEALGGATRSERPRREPARKEKAAAKGLTEVDLHASELLETTAGMEPGDILEYQLSVFRKTMDEHLCRKGDKIVFIHGKGDGVLRAALIKELKSRYRQCLWQDASFREYGFGATMVTIRS